VIKPTLYNKAPFLDHACIVNFTQRISDFLKRKFSVKNGVCYRIIIEKKHGAFTAEKAQQYCNKQVCKTLSINS